MLNVGFEMMPTTKSANWLKGRLPGWRSLEQRFVGSVIPEGFDAYARILHPAERRVPGGSWRPWKWSDMAAEDGMVVDPQTSFERVFGRFSRNSPRWLQTPDRSMGENECRSLVGVLKEFTATTERCYFCLWRGYGGLLEGRRWNKGTVRLPDRQGEKYVLFTGPLNAILSFYGYVDGRWWGQPPDFWWPEDLEWCVASNIDSYDTCVGGSGPCIEAVLEQPDLEAFPIGLEDRQVL